MTLLILLSIVATTAWMGVDASKRDWSTNGFARAPWQWVVGGLFLWIVAFPAYLLLRGRTPLRVAVGPAFAPAGLEVGRQDKPSTDSSGSVPPPGFRG